MVMVWEVVIGKANHAAGLKVQEGKVMGGRGGRKGVHCRRINVPHLARLHSK